MDDHIKEVTKNTTETIQPLYYVGIGASAGGLEALRPFVANLPTKSNMTYIVAQHMSPDHRSLMVELLARETKLHVEGAKHGVTPKENTIYVCPPNMDVTVQNGKLQLSKPSNTIGPKPSVNRFFISLAEDQEENSIGIVLSGTGSDAAHGIKAIKAAGGITVAQEPKTSKYDSMPNAAIRIGGADLILPPSDIASQLSLIILRPRSIEAEQSLVPSTIREIIQQIITSTGMDFTNYKEATLTRQITRRMAAKQIHTVESYGEYIANHPKELHELANNFLICVTSFFRDPQSFDAIKERIKVILDNKSTGSDIRIWVPGCATGEEVYSLAILINEEIESRRTNYRVQIFATDINNEAVITARAGVYPEAALAGLDDKIISKYFSIKNDMYVINKDIKDIVLFAKQNLVQDPPFVRLDLISCRNLLIYFKSELQENVMKLFHYCLRERGVLFLGQSETVGKQTDLFSEIDRKHKIYSKRTGVTSTVTGLSRNRTPLTLNTTTNEQIETISNQSLGQDRLFQLYAPASILVTDNGDVLEIFGDCSHFLSIKSGKANFNLYTLIRHEFRAEIRAFVHRASHGNESELGSITTLNIEGKEYRYRLVIHPLAPHDHSSDKLLLVCFEPVATLTSVGETSGEDASDAAIERISLLEHEAVLNRENLQTVIEELETANEELQSVNEEAQAANEELQASNEELETANEELQASNEELITVNDELNSRSLELSYANLDMNNILDAVYKALLVIDKDLKITRHNEMANQFFELTEDSSTNIARTKPRYDMPNLLVNIQEVLHTGKTIDSEFSGPSNQYYMMRITPNAGQDNNKVIEGIVITIEDISDRKEIEEKLRLSASVFDHASEATVITDADNKILSVNPAFTHITGYSLDEVLGKDPKILSANQQSEEFYSRMWNSISKQGSWAGELVNKRKNGEFYTEWLSVNVLKDREGNITRHIAVFSDISEAKKIQEVVKRQANYDALTGLPNRNLTLDRLEQLLLNSRREDKKFAVMFLDLDNFKSINDALGHNIGDELLITVATRLKTILRDVDSIGRLGGDEFIILLNNLSSENDAMTIANKALAEINRPMTLDGHTLQISSSIGITMYPIDGSSSDVLMKNADNAMYESKKCGRNIASFFTQEMQDKVNKDHWIEQELNKSFHKKQLELHYQPVIDIQEMKVIGAEALSRWPHPQKGLIPPIDFIPVAENCGLIHDLSQWVFDTGLDAANSWADDLSIAINLSVAQFSSNGYLDNLLTQIKNSPLSKKNRIIIEITESLELVENAKYLRILKELKESGCRIAIDDFGTGYSSLSYLSRLPIDIIKIDQSFIRDIAFDKADRTMVKVIIQIAKELGLETIAEGVETQEQLEFLIENGCDNVQGYLFSPACPQEKFAQYVENFNKKA